MLSLRSDQQRDVIKCLNHLFNDTHTLYTLPTGGGKTRVGVRIMRNWKDQRLGRVLFLAHSVELLEQAERDMIEDGLSTRIATSGKGVRQAFQSDTDVVLTTVGSMHRARKHQHDFKDVSLIVIDEAHRAASRTYREIFEALPTARRFGMTATPTRTDKKSLGKVFRKLTRGLTAAQLEKKGVLCGVRMFAPTYLDLTEYQTDAFGKYQDRDVVKAMEPLLGDVIKHYWQIARGRRAMLFASTAEQAQDLTEKFNDFTVDGDTPIRAEYLLGTDGRRRRQEVLEAFQDGRIDVLVNVDLFIEGLDVPDVECIILCRHTESLRVYLQAIGRGRRNPVGKQDLIVLDHSGNAHRFGHPNAAHEWSLDTNAKPQEANGEQSGPRVRICTHCDAQIPEGASKCPCGGKASSEVYLLTVDGVDLVEMPRENLDEKLGVPLPYDSKTDAELVRVAQELLGFADDMNFRWPLHWTRHKLKELFDRVVTLEFITGLDATTPSDRTKVWSEANRLAFIRNRWSG